MEPPHSGQPWIEQCLKNRRQGRDRPEDAPRVAAREPKADHRVLGLRPLCSRRRLYATARPEADRMVHGFARLFKHESGGEPDSINHGEPVRFLERHIARVVVSEAEDAIGHDEAANHLEEGALMRVEE